MGASDRLRKTRREKPALLPSLSKDRAAGDRSLWFAPLPPTVRVLSARDNCSCERTIDGVAEEAIVPEAGHRRGARVDPGTVVGDRAVGGADDRNRTSGHGDARSGNVVDCNVVRSEERRVGYEGWAWRAV